MPLAQVPEELRRAPFRGSVAVRQGLLTRKQLRSAVWTALHRDVFVWSGLSITPLIAAHAAALVLPPDGVLSGTTAAAVYGIALDRAHVEMTIPPSSSIRCRNGFAIRRRLLAPCDRTIHRGVPVTTAICTAFDVANHEPPEDAVIVLDALLMKGLVRPGELSRYTKGRAGVRGGHKAIRVCELSAVGAESPMESRNRLVLVLGGLPAPVCQFVVTDDCGAFLARVDLAYPELKIAIEYDGVSHRDADRYANDRWRDNLLVAAGWTVLRFTARDIYRFPERVVEQVAAAITAASATL